MKRTITLVLAILTALSLMAAPAMASGVIGNKPSGVIGTRP